MYWPFRLSAFRKDRRWERTGSKFGQPFEWTWEINDPSNYLPEGQLAFRYFVISEVVYIVALCIAIFLSI